MKQWLAFTPAYTVFDSFVDREMAQIFTISNEKSYKRYKPAYSSVYRIHFLNFILRFHWWLMLTSSLYWNGCFISSKEAKVFQIQLCVYRARLSTREFYLKACVHWRFNHYTLFVVTIWFTCVHHGRKSNRHCYRNNLFSVTIFENKSICF